jgi:AcrR family transcriptional regulator
MTTDPSDIQGKREQTKARNRAVILDAARAVFVEIGYDAASVRDIIARTDLAPGTFYNYFPDKQSVLVALASEATAQGSRRIRAARAEATSLSELAYRGYRAYFEFIVQDRVTFELMRRNISTLRTLGIDATGFAAGVNELREDLEQQLARENLPRTGMEYVPQIVAAIAFEVGATMVQSDPPDVEGATRFAAEICLGGLERLAKLSRTPAKAEPTKAETKKPEAGKTPKTAKSKKPPRGKIVRP